MIFKKVIINNTCESYNAIIQEELHLIEEMPESNRKEVLE